MGASPSGSFLGEVFAREWPRLVATLMADWRDPDLVEDAAQHAFERAATDWPTTGWPQRPGAWLVTAARHHLIDQSRRHRRFAERMPALARAELDPGHDPGRLIDEHRLVDDQLALILGCCHPSLNRDAQVALTLRLVCGLSSAQIASAFFVSHETMTRRLSRAKKKIRAAQVPFRIGDRDALPERLEVVAHVVYLVFTEGHTSSGSSEAGADPAVRGDLCDEAVWLAGLLNELVPDNAELLGLEALLVLTDSRRHARTGPDGRALLLDEQDRSRWDRAKIARGLELVARAHRLGCVGPFQLQAAIAAVHATAASAEATNWSAVVACYDALMSYSPTPVVALNRAVAVFRRDGPEAGWVALDAVPASALEDYPYLHSARAEMLVALGRLDEADHHFRAALAVARNEGERLHLEHRLASRGGQG